MSTNTDCTCIHPHCAVPIQYYTHTRGPMVVGWVRTFKAGPQSSSDLAADVNEDEVTQLLEDRSAAQTVKDYATADRIAQDLQDRGTLTG
jgi:cysteinyl-tRNA synthetase